MACFIVFPSGEWFSLKKVKKEEKPSRQSEITDNFRWFCFSFPFFFVAAPTADDFCGSFFGKISGKMAAARSFSWNYKGWPHGTLLLAYFVCFQLWVVGPTNTKNRGRFSRPYRFFIVWQVSWRKRAKLWAEFFLQVIRV